MNGSKPIFLSLQFRCIFNSKHYLETVNTTFIIDEITCQLLWQNVSSLILHLQANPMGREYKNLELYKYEIRYVSYFME
jgi:hypothetical protein